MWDTDLRQVVFSQIRRAFLLFPRRWNPNYIGGSGFKQAQVSELAAGDGFVEFYVSGQRVSAQLSDGRDGRDRQTLQVSSGLATKVRKRKQVKKLIELANTYSRAHTFITVFVESLGEGEYVFRTSILKRCGDDREAMWWES